VSLSTAAVTAAVEHQTFDGLVLPTRREADHVKFSDQRDGGLMKMLPAIPRAQCSEAVEGAPVKLSAAVARLIDFELRSKRAPYHAGEAAAASAAQSSRRQKESLK